MGSWRGSVWVVGGSVWVVGGLLAVASAEGLPLGVGLVTDDPSIVASGCASLPVVTCDSQLATTCQIICKRSPFASGQDEQTLLSAPTSN